MGETITLTAIEAAPIQSVLLIVAAAVFAIRWIKAQVFLPAPSGAFFSFRFIYVCCFKSL